MEIKAMTGTSIATMSICNWHLVVMSIVIAIIASYTALDLAGRVTVAQGLTRKLWLAGGAIAMGVGIWSMHFIGMVAYNLPIAMTYDLPIVLASMAVAVVASGAALFVVSRQRMGGLKLLAGCVFMGLGIAAMHYTGMAAMQLKATPMYDLKLVALSIAIALSASLIALWLAFHLRAETTMSWSWRKIGSAIVMGDAIAGMHYTGMAALSFKLTDPLVVQQSHAMDNSMLGVGIGIVTLVILSVVLTTSLFDQRLRIEAARAEVVRQSEERFRSLVQNTSDIIAVFAADGTVGYTSPCVKRILGYEPENWQKAFEIVYPDDLTKAQSLLTVALLCPAVNITAEYRLQHADGQARDFEVIVNNLLSEPGVAGIVTTYRDITERKRAEKALQQAHDELEIRVEQRTTELRNAFFALQSEIIERQRADEALRMQQEFLRHVINTTPNCIFVKDWERKYTLVNQATANLFGTTIEEIVGKTDADYNAKFEEVKQFNGEDAEVMETLREKIISEEIITDATGKVRWFHTIKKPLISSDGKVTQVLGVATDITELKQAQSALQKANDELESRVEQRTTQLRIANQRLQREIIERERTLEALRESELKLRLIFENSTDAIFLKDKEGQYLFINPAGAKLLGRPTEKILGKRDEELLTPENGRQIWESDQSLMASGTIKTDEEILESCGVKRTYLTTKCPYISPQGEVIGLMGICRDITERKQAEETLKESVQQLAKLNRLKDEFLSTVSHELRTPMTNMKMAIHMLKIATDPERRERYLDILQTECVREAQMINDLLDLQRLEATSYHMSLETLSLQEWLPSIIEPFRSRTTSCQQTLQLNLSPDLPPLLCDSASLGRILAELLNNACKYTPAGGEISLSIRQEEDKGDGRRDKGKEIPLSSPHPSSVTIFAVRNEAEIPAAELPRIFEKFYRVNHADPWKQGGTGLGLALVQKLVEQVQGTIQVESSRGWTTFTVELPNQLRH